MSNMNRFFNASNPYQGKNKKVLCVCSAGLLRSPTTARLLTMPPYNFNTRAAGLDVSHALIPVDDVLLHWADFIVCMTKEQKTRLESMTDKTIYCLNVPDNYAYGDPILERLIVDSFNQVYQGDTDGNQ